jgi:anthranilate/para-aminobenzoate synthase component I
MGGGFWASKPECDQDEAGFSARVRAAQEYIRAGEIYQANLSLRFRGGFRGDPFALYLALRRINPSPFCGYIEFPDQGLAVVSSSPERLVSLRGRKASTRPIAGTRPRGADLERDTVLRQEMFLSEKERAEHVMLVDLERNDLGRVCEPGSVRVDELMVAEGYSHVQHIVSEVSGTLHPGRSPADLVRAVFPGGTITGCPKVRCMEILRELEREPRGPFYGCAGWAAPGGDMDLNILIRTALIKNGTISFRVGAGIVADSVPAREHEETLHKARALVSAYVMTKKHNPSPAPSPKRRGKFVF